MGAEICRQLTRFTVHSAPTPRLIGPSQTNLTLVFNNLYLGDSLCQKTMQPSQKIRDLTWVPTAPPNYFRDQLAATTSYTTCQKSF